MTERVTSYVTSSYKTLPPRNKKKDYDKIHAM